MATEAPPPLQPRATEQLFRQLDADGSGQIDVVELRAALLQHGFGPREAEQMLRAVDTDRSGQVSLAEFKDAFSSLSSQTLGGLLHEWHSRGAQVSVGGDLTGMAAPPSGTPVWRAALAGSSGAAASRLVAAPLEKVTLIMQVSGKTGVAHALTALRETVRREGLSGLWAGAFTNCVRVALFGGCVCVGYSNALKLTPADGELDSMEPVYRSAAGGAPLLFAARFLDWQIGSSQLRLPQYSAAHTLAPRHARRNSHRRSRRQRGHPSARHDTHATDGGGAGLASTREEGPITSDATGRPWPWEPGRAPDASLAALGHAGRYTGAAHAAREAIARDGWRSLWRGVGPAMAAVAPFIAVQQSL